MLEILIVKRLLLAVLLGAIIGFERERAHKVAGLRTHVLVCVSSALFAIIAIYGFTDATAESTARIIANIILGVGFIGGGAILRQESRIMGTTTAATLWTVAAIGIAAGIGFAYAAVLATLIGYVVLSVIGHLESRITGSTHAEETHHEAAE